jgi:hypothetical protein
MKKASIDINEKIVNTLPAFLREQFVRGPILRVKIKRIRVGMKMGPSSNIKYTSIYSTPHYDFINKYLRYNKSVPYNHDYGYYSIDNADASSPEEFIALADSIISEGYDYDSHPIYVFNNWRRFLPIGRLDVADGFHRLAILAALGKQNVEVCKLKYKQTMYSRFMRISDE